MDNQTKGHNTITTKVCGGNYRVTSSIGTFSVHRFQGKWFVRLWPDGGLVALETTKAKGMEAVWSTIKDVLAGNRVRYIADPSDHA